MKIFANKEKMPRIAFLISGRGSNMTAILKKIKEKKLKANPVLVFSDNEKAEGLKKAKLFNVPVLSFSPKKYNSFEEYEQALVKILKENKVEWVICAGYMRLLKKTVLTAYENRIVNIHPALLPSFPGLKAQKQAVDYGVKFSGCTIHLIDEGCDTGPIVIQSVIEVLPKDNEETLSKKILKLEHDTYWRALKKLFDGFILKDRKITFK
ncbi:MAG: phosphoribosylglycinamide formyltransferase [Spirochaetia bacterium]|nr:phosphoribosylglycinamide formyltransferase [Spirochaetia bacterium]